MKQSKSILAIVLLFFTIIHLNAQDSVILKKLNKDMLTHFHVKFTKPDGYIYRDSGFLNSCEVDGGMETNSIASLQSLDSNILISWMFGEFPKEKDIYFIRLLKPNYDPGKFFFTTLTHIADTSTKTFTLIVGNEAKEIYNADTVAIVTSKCHLGYDNKKYPYHRTVLIYSHEKYIIIMTYLFSEAAKYKIDDELKRIAGFLRFENDL